MAEAAASNSGIIGKLGKGLDSFWQKGYEEVVKDYPFGGVVKAVNDQLLPFLANKYGEFAGTVLAGETYSKDLIKRRFTAARHTDARLFLGNKLESILGPKFNPKIVNGEVTLYLGIRFKRKPLTLNMDMLFSNADSIRAQVSGAKDPYMALLKIAETFLLSAMDASGLKDEVKAIMALDKKKPVLQTAYTVILQKLIDYILYSPILAGTNLDDYFLEAPTSVNKPSRQVRAYRLELDGLVNAYNPNSANNNNFSFNLKLEDGTSQSMDFYLDFMYESSPGLKDNAPLFATRQMVGLIDEVRYNPMGASSSVIGEFLRPGGFREKAYRQMQARLGLSDDEFAELRDQNSARFSQIDAALHALFIKIIDPKGTILKYKQDNKIEERYTGSAKPNKVASFITSLKGKPDTQNYSRLQSQKIVELRRGKPELITVPGGEYLTYQIPPSSLDDLVKMYKDNFDDKGNPTQSANKLIEFTDINRFKDGFNKLNKTLSSASAGLSREPATGTTSHRKWQKAKESIDKLSQLATSQLLDAMISALSEWDKSQKEELRAAMQDWILHGQPAAWQQLAITTRPNLTPQQTQEKVKSSLSTISRLLRTMRIKYIRQDIISSFLLALNIDPARWPEVGGGLGQLTTSVASLEGNADAIGKIHQEVISTYSNPSFVGSLNGLSAERLFSHLRRLNTIKDELPTLVSHSNNLKNALRNIDYPGKKSGSTVDLAQLATAPNILSQIAGQSVSSNRANELVPHIADVMALDRSNLELVNEPSFITNLDSARDAVFAAAWQNAHRQSFDPEAVQRGRNFVAAVRQFASPNPLPPATKLAIEAHIYSQPIFANMKSGNTGLSNSQMLVYLICNEVANPGLGPNSNQELEKFLTDNQLLNQATGLNKEEVCKYIVDQLEDAAVSANPNTLRPVEFNYINQVII